MPRKKLVSKRIVVTDPVYNSLLVSKFVNGIMLDGKKSIARQIFYGAMDILESRIKEDAPLVAFEKAVEAVRPRVEVKSRRVGGATYQVPVEVALNRRNALAIRWLVDFAKKRSGKTMAEKLAGELIDAYHNRGAAVKKREDTHKMADANKAFAHYRW